MMDILVADLHKDAAGFVQQFAGQQQAVAQVGEVGVDAQFPGVAEGADLLRLGGQVFVLAVFNFSLTVDGRFCSISSRKCPYSLWVAFFERETVVPQI
jgi:hypothetical protein